MTSLTIVRLLLPYLAHIGPAWFRRRVVELIPNPHVQRIREVSDIMNTRAWEIFNEKKRGLHSSDAALLEQVGEGKDVMSLLRELRFSLTCKRSAGSGVLTYVLYVQ